MTREEAISLLHDMKDTYDEIHENTNYEIGYEQMTALDMAIEALSKHNYETDTEVRLAVVNRHKDRVILFDPFGEEEYLLPSAEQVTGKLQNPCDSLLTDDKAECKEQKSKLDLISRADVRSEEHTSELQSRI